MLTGFGLVSPFVDIMQMGSAKAYVLRYFRFKVCEGTVYVNAMDPRQTSGDTYTTVEQLCQNGERT